VPAHCDIPTLHSTMFACRCWRMYLHSARTDECIRRRDGCVCMPNFVEIAQTAAEIWRFFDFSRWQPSAILDFQKLEISTSGAVRRPNVHHRTKCGLLPNYFGRLLFFWRQCSYRSFKILSVADVARLHVCLIFCVGVFSRAHYD